MIVTPNGDAFAIGSVKLGDIPLVTMILATVLSSVAVTIPRDHLRLAITLSCVGFSLCVIYAFMGAPDVALVAVLVETFFSLIFLGMLLLMPRRILRYESRRVGRGRHTRRDILLASTAGAVAFVVAWGTLSRTTSDTGMIDSQAALTPLAHGKAVVTVVLADFRGFDTMGEITVIAITLLGIIFFAELAGLAGAFLAVPAAAVMQIVLRELFLLRRERLGLPLQGPVAKGARKPFWRRRQRA